MLGGGGEEEETATVKQGVKKEENERRNGEITLPSPLNLLTFQDPYLCGLHVISDGDDASFSSEKFFKPRWGQRLPSGKNKYHVCIGL